MKTLRKFMVPVLALVLMLVLFTGSASASARTASWTVSVTYQNVGAAAASLVVNFYAENSSTPISFDPLNGGTLAPGAGRSFFIGAVSSVPAGFQGNAVISADQPLVSTAVQFSQDAGFKMRLLYNGFSSGQASNQVLVATVLKNKFNRTTVFSIQNTENEAVNATVKFYDADNNGTLAATVTHNIPANSSKFIEMDSQTDTGISATVFNGSAIVTAVKVNGGASANVVAAANEYYTNSNVAASFEGIPLTNAANTIYMATALCERFGLDTFYAVSNALTSGNAQITVNYYNTNGTAAGSDGPYTIGAGQKKSITTCQAVSPGFTGSAVITSTGNAIVAIGKAQNSINAGTTGTQDVFTIFLGEQNGATELAIPFVRWANNTDFQATSNTGGKQRTYIAIQNLGSSTISVTCDYKDKNGATAGSQTLTIAGNSKGNTDASTASALGASGMLTDSFGYYTDGTTGGGVTCTSAGSFIAIARSQHPGEIGRASCRETL